MKRTVKQMVAVAAVALCSSAMSADYRHITQDQLEDIMYGVGVTARVGEPFGRIADDRRHYGDLVHNDDSLNQPSEYHPYARVNDDRDNRDDLVYGSPGFDRKGEFGPVVAGQ